MRWILTKKALRGGLLWCFVFAGSFFLQGEESQPTSKTDTEGFFFEWNLKGEYLFPSREGYKTGYVSLPHYGSYIQPPEEEKTFPLRSIGSFRKQDGFAWGSPGVEASFRSSYRRPLWDTQHFLTKDNHLEGALEVAITPISAALKSALIFSPVAFAEISLGAEIATGWPLGSFVGIGLVEKATGIRNYRPGVFSKVGGALTLQFDLAALIPGDWNHVFVWANGEVSYQHYSAAGKGDFWIYRDDAGENSNEFRYKGFYVLGYKMPLTVDLVGFLVETNERLGAVRNLSPMSQKGWGSDFTKVSLGPVVNWKLTENLSLTFHLAGGFNRRYSEESIFYRWFGDRSATGTYFAFERFAVVLKQTF